MKIKIILFLVMLSYFGGCTNTTEIRSPRKEISKQQTYLLAEGRWKATSGNIKYVIPKINTTSIVCDLRKMEAREIVSYIDKNSNPGLLLYSHEFIYKIIEYKNNILKAHYKSPVADIDIVISLDDNSAKKKYRETQARGVQSSDPNNYGEWILE